MALSLNAGETYVINNVSPGATPQVKVITNPNALVIHNEEPGKVTLLGAAAGEWTVGVKLADGTAVDYDVTVSAVGNINNINHPGTAPAVIAGSGASVGSAAPPVATLDPGAGPVASAAFILVVDFFVYIDDRNHYDHSSRPGNGSLVERTCARERRARAGGSAGGQSFDLRFLS